MTRSLRIHGAAFSVRGLSARHPRTGELMSTMKFMVQTQAAAGELRRGLRREPAYDALCAAGAEGDERGHRPGVPRQIGRHDD